MVYLFYIVLIILMIFLDQVSKYIIVSKFSLGQSIEIIKNFFSLTYVQNFGAGFSIMQNQTYTFYIITVLAILILTYMLLKAKKEEKLNKISFLLIIGGAFGNFIDRLTHIYVIDFLDFNIFGWDFPVFNIADCFVTVGCFLLIISTILEYKHAKN